MKSSAPLSRYLEDARLAELWVCVGRVSQDFWTLWFYLLEEAGSRRCVQTLPLRAWSSANPAFNDLSPWWRCGRNQSLWTPPPPRDFPLTKWESSTTISLDFKPRYFSNIIRYVDQISINADIIELLKLYWPWFITRDTRGIISIMDTFIGAVSSKNTAISVLWIEQRLQS